MQPPTPATRPDGRRPLPPLPPRRPLPPRQAGAVASVLTSSPSASGAAAIRPAVASPAAARPAHQTRPANARSRPDPTGHRLAIGFGGLAAASALAAAFLTPATAATPAPVAPVTSDVGPVQRDIQYIQLLPGQTPPANAAVAAQAPAPTPRVVVVTTRQSGTRP